MTIHRCDECRVRLDGRSPKKLLSYSTRFVSKLVDGPDFDPRFVGSAATDGPIERQLGFLAALSSTRSVGLAAAAVGMSREGAYRLRSRRGSELFAALWDRTLGAACDAGVESHIRPLSDGALTRLLGNHFRREAGDFRTIGGASWRRSHANRT